jgi:hypothetical protein
VSGVLSFLRERLGERSSQVQLVALVLTGAVASGLVTMEQIQAWAGKFGSLLILLGPIAGFLVPERKPSMDEVAQAADAMIAADPRFVAVREQVETAADAFEAAVDAHR